MATKTLTQALVVTVMRVAMVLAAVPFVRGFLRRFVLTPGSGPSDKVVSAGKFSVKGVAHLAAGEPVTASMKFSKGEGYAFTAVSACEIALSILAGEAGRTGVLTPATAVGEALLKRLTAAGAEFSSKL
jgi:short subunit dehydrogenase-like uncharacterized protein